MRPNRPPPDSASWCQFDLLQVYYEPNHEMRRQWVGLIDPSNPDDRGTWCARA